MTKPDQAVRLPAADVLRGRDIICFSNDWSGDPLSKTHLMRLLARDNRVLWINSIGYRAPTASKADISRAFRKLVAAAGPVTEPERNIFVLNPIAIPAYSNSHIRELNRHLLRFQVKRAMRRLSFQRPVNWVYMPAAAVVAGNLGEDLLIYHCVDEYTGFSGVSAQSIAELEGKLIRRSDLVVVSSDLLYQSKVRMNPRTVLVRHGVDHEHFRRALRPETVVPDDIARLPRPVIGFFGLIADWVDVDLIAYVAEQFPEGSLVLLGKATTDVSALERLPNVHLLGRKHYDQLPAYCKGFDVALMPFRINELTLNSNPLKVREYLAAGLDVISTPIPEVEVLGLCRIGTDKESFVREVRAALMHPGPSAGRSNAVRGESWEARLDDIRGHVAALWGGTLEGSKKVKRVDL
ncbi:MAG: glycosyltransferase [Acidobacteriota bacterium]|nr:glycosyltransferase [Acidobacteriota bacterium]